ncbi:MAG: hypothetical protein WAZ34_12070 [Rhodocyclaceae bacterium]
MSVPEISSVGDYLCVGICMADPDSGYCLGCGRPPLPVSSGDQRIVAEVQDFTPAQTSSSDPDSPEAA